MADSDADSTNDKLDIRQLIANADQLDTDEDGAGNARDADDDGDGVDDDVDAFSLDMASRWIPTSGVEQR